MRQRQVIITRAEPGASETAARLLALDFHPLKLPALKIVNCASDDLQPPETGEVYIFTSANGVRAVAETGWPIERPAICVGPATFEAAQAAGLSELQNADGNSDSVYELICEEYQPASAPQFIHVANRHAAGELQARLAEAGFSVRFEPLYKTLPVQWSAIQHQWKAVVQKNACILIHSAKGAEAVKNWLIEGQIAPHGLRVVAISERSLVPLSVFPFAGRAVAQQPNEDELVKALQSALI